MGEYQWSIGRYSRTGSKIAIISAACSLPSCKIKQNLKPVANWVDAIPSILGDLSRL